MKMIKIANPLEETQDLIFETQEEYNDWLCTNFNKAVNDVAEATGRKAILVNALNEQCKDEKQSGTVKVTGEYYQASIVRGVTPKYDTLDKSEDPILQRLYTLVEEAREFIRISFDERVSGMQEWIDQCANDEFKDFSDEEKALIKQFIACRRLQASSPQIKIKQIKEPTTINVNM